MSEGDSPVFKEDFVVKEQEGATMLQLMKQINTMSLDRFQEDVLATKAEYERSDAILAGMGVGWSPEFISCFYHRASRNLIAIFVRDIRKLSISLVLALYMAFEGTCGAFHAKIR